MKTHPLSCAADPGAGAKTLPRSVARRNRWMGSIVLGAVFVFGCGGHPPGNASDAKQASEGRTGSPPAAPTSGSELVERMIAFHDPDGAWPSAELSLQLEESRPDGTVRSTTVALDNAASEAQIRTQRDGHDIEMRVSSDAVSYQVDASAELAQELIEQLRLGDDQVRRTRNYYLYLYGLPMKLRDPGTRIAEEIERSQWQGREVLTARVTYDQEVGGDTWLFYADPETYEMVGYRFFHDEAKGDGEYIVLEGLYEVGGMRLPKRRTWYTNLEDELLGTDEIVG